MSDQLPSLAKNLAAMPALVAHLRLRLPHAPEEPAGWQPDQPRCAAVLLPLYERDGAPYLLFTQRAATLRAHRGEMSFPGGSREARDRSLGETALRESQEELALDPARVELLGALPPLFTVVSNFLVTPLVGFLPEGPGILHPNPAEVAKILEIPLFAFADPAIFHVERWTRNGAVRLVYFFDYPSARIWGVTAHILYTLLQRLSSDPPPL